MQAHPEMLRGPVAADALLIRSFDGWVAKGGAEGLFCALLAGRARRSRSRSRTAPSGRCCRRSRRCCGGLGIDPAGLGETPVENSRGERVGELTVA